MSGALHSRGIARVRSRQLSPLSLSALAVEEESDAQSPRSRPARSIRADDPPGARVAARARAAASREIGTCVISISSSSFTFVRKA
jgi:hypothetical protein